MTHPDVVAMHFAALRGDLKQAPKARLRTSPQRPAVAAWRAAVCACAWACSADVGAQVKALEQSSSLGLDDAGYLHFACRSGDLPTVQYVLSKFAAAARCTTGLE